MNKINTSSPEKCLLNNIQAVNQPLHKKEVIQLIANFLLVADFLETWKELQSRCNFISDIVHSSNDLRDAIMDGNWQKAIEVINKTVDADKDRVPKSEFSDDVPSLLQALLNHMVHEQHYLELINADKVNEAVALLRSHLAAFRKSSLTATRSIESLCQILGELDKTNWQAELEWNGEEHATRLQLLNNIRFLLHTFLQRGMTPTRMSDLLDMGIKDRMTRWATLQPHTIPTSDMSHYLTLAKCNEPLFPSRLWMTNCQWYFHKCLFSPSGKYLAALAQPFVVGTNVDNSSKYVLILFAAPSALEQDSVEESSDFFSTTYRYKENGGACVNDVSDPNFLLSRGATDHPSWTVLRLKVFREFDSSPREMQLEWRYDSTRLLIAATHNVYVFRVPSLSSEKYPRPLREDNGSDKIMRCIPNTDLLMFATEGGQCKVVTTQNQTIRLSSDATFRTKCLAIHLGSEVLAVSNSSTATPVSYPLRLYVVDYLQRVRCLTWLLSETFALRMSRRLLKEHLQSSKEAADIVNGGSVRSSSEESGRPINQLGVVVNVSVETESRRAVESVLIGSMEDVHSVGEDNEAEEEDIVASSSSVFSLLIGSGSNTSIGSTMSSQGRSSSHSPRYQRYVSSTQSPISSAADTTTSQVAAAHSATTSSSTTLQQHPSRSSSIQIQSRSGQSTEVTSTDSSYNSQGSVAQRDSSESLYSTSDPDSRLLRQLFAAVWYAGSDNPGATSGSSLTTTSTGRSPAVFSPSSSSSNNRSSTASPNWRNVVGQPPMAPPIPTVPLSSAVPHTINPPGPFSQATAYVQLGGGITAAIYAPPIANSLAPSASALPYSSSHSHMLPPSPLVASLNSQHLAAALLRAANVPYYNVPSHLSSYPAPTALPSHLLNTTPSGIHLNPMPPVMVPTSPIGFPQISATSPIYPHSISFQQRLWNSYISSAPVTNRIAIPSQLPLSPPIQAPTMLPPPSTIDPFIANQATPYLLSDPPGLLTSRAITSPAANNSSLSWLLEPTTVMNSGVTAGVSNTPLIIESSNNTTDASGTTGSSDRRRQASQIRMADNLAGNLLLRLGSVISSSGAPSAADTAQDPQSSYNGNGSPPSQADSSEDVLIVPNAEDSCSSLCETVIHSPDEILDIQVSTNAQWLLTLHKYCIRVWNAVSGNLIRDLIPPSKFNKKTTQSEKATFLEQRLCLCGALKEFVAAVTEDDRVVFWRFLSSCHPIHVLNVANAPSSPNFSLLSSIAQSLPVGGNGHKADDFSPSSSEPRESELSGATSRSRNSISHFTCCPIDSSLMAVITSEHTLQIWNASKCLGMKKF